MTRLDFDLFEDRRRERARADLLARRARGLVAGILAGLLLAACCLVMAATLNGFFNP